MQNDQYELSLPPMKNNEVSIPRGHLSITPVSLTFFKKKNSTHMLKFQFWGAEQPTYLQME